VVEENYRSISDILKTFFSYLFCFVTAFNAFSQAEQLKALAEKSRIFLSKDEPDSAIVYTGKLLSEAKKENNTHYVIIALYTEADAYQKQGKAKKATDCYYAALKLCKDTSENFQKALIYNRLGVINYRQEQNQIAKEFFRQEIKLRRLMGDVKQLANNFINLSSVHMALMEHDSSAYMISELYKIVSKTKDPSLTGHYYNGNAVHYYNLYTRDSLSYYLDSAIINYKKAAEVWFSINNKTEAFRPIFNIGHAYHTKKQFAKALDYYKQADQLSGQLGLSREKMLICGNIGEAYYDLKDFKRASEYFKKYVEIKDSLSKIEIADYALKLDKQFQTEKNKETIQQQQLELARKEIQLSGQQKKLYLYILIIVIVLIICALIFLYFNFQKRLTQKTEEAKKKFFSNVVHEIRTPLSMIQAPLKVLKTKHNTEDDIYNIEIAERNIKRLNELVNQMLDISKIESTTYNLNETFGDLDIFFNQLISNYTKKATEKNIILLHRINLQSKLACFD